MYGQYDVQTWPLERITLLMRNTCFYFTRFVCAFFLVLFAILPNGFYNAQNWLEIFIFYNSNSVQFCIIWLNNFRLDWNLFWSFLIIGVFSWNNGFQFALQLCNIATSCLIEVEVHFPSVNIIILPFRNTGMPIRLITSTIRKFRCIRFFFNCNRSKIYLRLSAE